LIVAAVHGAAAVRLLADLLDDQAAAVLEDPYRRALDDTSAPRRTRSKDHD